jgi:hypothetical protein
MRSIVVKTPTFSVHILKSDLNCGNLHNKKHILFTFKKQQQKQNYAVI